MKKTKKPVLKKALSHIKEDVKEEKGEIARSKHGISRDKLLSKTLKRGMSRGK